MDTQIECKIPEFDKFPDFCEKQFVVGAKQLQKVLRNGTAQQVYLARNADPALTGNLEQLCRETAVPYTWVPSMQDLGRACGIDVGAAAAAVVG